MPDTSLFTRTRRVLELAAEMRRTSTPPTVDTEAFMVAAAEHAKLVASGWAEEIARAWLLSRDYTPVNWAQTTGARTRRPAP